MHPSSASGSLVVIRSRWACSMSSPGPSATSGMSRRVVPGVAVGQEPVGSFGAPGPAGVGVDRDLVAEHRVDDLPGGLDGVLAGELPAFALQRGADQPVVGTLVTAGA